MSFAVNFKAHNQEPRQTSAKIPVGVTAVGSIIAGGIAVALKKASTDVADSFTPNVSSPTNISWAKNCTMHEEILLLAANSYNKSNYGIPPNWRELPEHQIDKFAKVFKSADDKTIVIAYKGTDRVKDVFTDLKLLFGSIDKVGQRALQLCEEIQKAFPDKEIIVTGHSLGGTLAQYVGVKHEGVKTVTFAAAGIRGSVPLAKSSTEYRNIVNYIVENDPVTKLPSPGIIKTLKQKTHTSKLDGIKQHYIKNYVNQLETFTEVDPIKTLCPTLKETFNVFKKSTIRKLGHIIKKAIR